MEIIDEAQNANDKFTSLKELESIVGRLKFQQLMKGI